VLSTPPPLLRSLTPGERILLVTPVGLPKSPAWMVLIQRATDRWTRALNHDRLLRHVATSNAKVYSAGVAVSGSVYVVR
jgi:hypothetical protein